MKKLFLAVVVAALALVSCNKEHGRNITDVAIHCGTNLVDAYQVMFVDSIVYLRTDVTPAKSKEILSWEIEDPSIAAIYMNEDDKGRVVAIKGLKPGDTILSIKSESGFETKRGVTVFANPVKVEGLKISPSELTVKVGEGATVEALLTPEDADCMVEWTISDESVLEYDWEENVQYYFSALKTGKASIIAKAGEFSAECVVTVVSSYVSLSGVSLSKTNYTVQEGGRFSITPTFTPSNATNKAIHWDIQDRSIVDLDGTVGTTSEFISYREGQTALVGTSLDGSFTITALVTVTPPTPPADAVDLGYRYGNRRVYFHKYNLGSKQVHTAGELYAWGDPVPYYEMDGPRVVWKDGKSKGYAKEDYKWYDASSKSYTKYMDSPRQVGLDLQDDPAQKQLGGNWRMPNPADLWWLINECTWTVDYENLSYIVASKVPGYEDQLLIIPMTGYYEGTKYLGYGQVDGMSIYPFSTILACNNLHYNGDGTFNNDYIDTAFASMLTINGTLMSSHNMMKSERYYGYTIRPVWETGMKK